MQFNEHWTKEKNDQLRQMIKERKSTKEIIKFFGEELLSYHPKNKYIIKEKRILPFLGYVKEISTSPKFTSYNIQSSYSISYKDKKDYLLNFELSGKKYIIVLFYIITKGIESYNILFTTKEQYDEYEEKLQEIIKNKIDNDLEMAFTDKENDLLSNIVEKETDYGDFFEIIKSVSYILFSFYINIKGYLLSINDTERKIKINSYRDIIKNSFKDVKETKDFDESDKPIYYFEINE